MVLAGKGTTYWQKWRIGMVYNLDKSLVKTHCTKHQEKVDLDIQAIVVFYL